MSLKISSERGIAQDGLYQFGNGGIYVNTLLDFDFLALAKEIEEIRNDFLGSVSATGQLIGQLENSFDIVKSRSLIERVTVKNALEHNEMVNHWDKFKINFAQENRNVSLQLGGCWVNFQQKYEYQPMHDHSGIYSFIIFYNIPFMLDEEDKVAPGRNANDRVSGRVNFHYSTYNGKISTMTLPVEKGWEKKIIVFPAELMHSVAPFFSSDDYRITVSGNLVPKL
jgi:hypothetical protein